MRSFSTLSLVVALLIGACGGDDTDEVQTAVTLTETTAAVATTTTTLPPSTTTTIPKANIKVEIGVYDGWIRTAWDYCWTRVFKEVDFIWIGRYAEVLLEDASNDEVIAVAELGPGQVEEDGEGYEYCVFHGTFHDVPLDRSLYSYSVEGEHWGGEVTVEASELRDRKVSTVYFEEGEQRKREEAPND